MKKKTRPSFGTTAEKGTALILINIYPAMDKRSRGMAAVVIKCKCGKSNMASLL